MNLFSLPNEILIHLLDLLPTNLLLHTRSVCHRFQNLIVRILHGRLLVAASLQDRKLILECYHPSAQYTEPYLYCDYLGTPGLSDHIQGQGSIYEVANQHPDPGTLRKLYSRFRPVRKDTEPRIPRSHPAGDVPGSRTSDATTSSMHSAEGNLVSQTVSLEAHELFSQLRVFAAVVKTGPRRGFFSSVEALVDQKTTRIWREWLAQKARINEELLAGGSNNALHDTSDSGSDAVLWIDQNKIAGFKVHVKERKLKRDTPILLHKDEDQPVSYSLELQELLISTTHLMLAVERPSLETSEESGKAMVFGSFAVQSTQQTPINVDE